MVNPSTLLHNNTVFQEYGFYNEKVVPKKSRFSLGLRAYVGFRGKALTSNSGLGA